MSIASCVNSLALGSLADPVLPYIGVHQHCFYAAAKLCVPSKMNLCTSAGDVEGALLVFRHLEALWFANVANSILWWAFVKVRCSQAMLFTGTAGKLFGLPFDLQTVGWVLVNSAVSFSIDASAGLVESAYHPPVLLLLQDGTPPCSSYITAL